MPRNLLYQKASSEEHDTLENLVQEKIRGQVSEYIHQGGEDLLNLILSQVERPLLKLVLEQTRWNQNRTAKILGINRNTLRKKIEELGLQKIVTTPS